MEQGSKNTSKPKATLAGGALNPDDYAAYLRISRATLYRWIAAGIVPQPCIRKGRIVRWTRAAVDRNIEDLTN